MGEDELGVPPKVILDEAIEIPIYLNGVQKSGIWARLVTTQLGWEKRRFLAA